MNVFIDELQMEKFIAPIFSSLIKNNAPDELIKNVFFDTKIPEYFECLPKSLQENSSFIFECLERNLISASDVPKNLLNSELISKDKYLKIIENDYNFLGTNVYPQDEQIILSVLKNNIYGYHNIEEKFTTNSELMIKCLVQNSELFRLLSEDIQDDFLGNKEVMLELVKKQPDFLNYLNNDQLTQLTKDPKVIEAALNTFKGYDLIKESLRTIKDPEIALLALKVTDGARKFIHQSFNSILKENKITSNCHNFLKIYLLEFKLQKEIIPETKNTSSKFKL
jgi:hypothetical protein